MVGDRSARWAPDPSGRHQHRFWDGTAWTEYVSDRGRSSLDPFPLAGATALHMAAPASDALTPAPLAIATVPAPAAEPAPAAGPATMPATVTAAAPPAQRPASSAVSPVVRPMPSPAARIRAPHSDLPAEAAPAGDGAGGAVPDTPDGPRPRRGPNRLPSHRERRGALRRATPPLAVFTLLFAVALALARF